MNFFFEANDSPLHLTIVNMKDTIAVQLVQPNKPIRKSVRTTWLPSYDLAREVASPSSSCKYMIYNNYKDV